MIHLRQHIPDYVSGYDPEAAEIEKPEDFRELDWVKPWDNRRDFVRWVQSHRDLGLGLEDWLLMAEVSDGKWWVVAYVDGDLGLPEWERPNG